MKYFSLFSGIGGFELGFENSNKDMFCVGCSEIDKYATSIYKKHFPNVKNYGDVRKIKTEELPEFDFLVGGFPCQSFSIAGKRRGFDDTRGTLFFEIARFLKDCQPKYFLLENVRNLLSHEKGKTFQRILGIFSELGYDVEWKVLNSSDYGIPQNRKRVFLKGYFRERCGGEILSIGEVNEKTDKKISNKLVKLNNFKSQAGIIYDINGVSCTLTGCGGGWGGKTGLYDVGKYFEMAAENKYITTNSKGDCLTITQTNRSSPLSKKQDNYVIDLDSKYKNKIRRLTPLECERLQAFPDNWTKYGFKGEKISDSQRYKCLGNAVTTVVVTEIMNNWNIKEN